MRSILGRRPSPATVISLIALFAALGGTSYAATTLAKNSVGSKQLKKDAVTTSDIKANAVTGAKVKTDSLTGSDVNESTLAKVPSAGTADAATTAKTADTAGTAGKAADADKLGGKPASEYLAAGTVTRFGPVKLTKGDPTKNIVTKGPFTLQAKCSDDGGNNRIDVFMATTEENSVANRASQGAIEAGSDLDPTDDEPARMLWNESRLGRFFTGGYTFAALAPSGQHVEGQFTLGFGFQGADCQISGYLIG